MQINCPNCRTQVLAGNINMEKMAAVCAKCNHLFSFEEGLARAIYRKPEVWLTPRWRKSTGDERMPRTDTFLDLIV